VSAKRVLLALAALALLGLVAVGVVLAILVPRYVEREVIAQAKERGLELVPGEIAFGWGWVQVSKAKAKLIGVRSLSASFEIADATLAGTKPLSFALSDVKLEAVGDPLILRDELSSWARTYEKRTTEPVSVTGFAFTLRREAGALPDLTLGGGKLTVQSGRFRLDAERANLRGQALGAVRLSRDAEKAALAVTLGQSSLDNPLLALEYREGEQTLVHAALSPISAGNLSKALGIGLPRPDVVVSGSVDLEIPKNLLVGGRVTGRVDFTLKGYIPPHPIELDGFVFGDTTEVGAALKLEPERLRVLISDAKVKAGRFALGGGGELRAEGRQGRLTLALRGELPCNALAGVVAETRLGKALGVVTGKAARMVVGGGVGVRVSVDLSTDKPEAARVVKTITPGCGLRPLSFEELVKLGELAPEALDPAVMADLKRLIEEGVPPPPPGSALPNVRIPGLGQLGLPTLPPLPGFELKKPGSQSGGASSK
jgi:ADP-dependent NAD(P)H-hydrate dehydratase / NAD(P)H-hydrate epimerase